MGESALPQTPSAPGCCSAERWRNPWWRTETVATGSRYD